MGNLYGQSIKQQMGVTRMDVWSRSAMVLFWMEVSESVLPIQKFRLPRTFPWRNWIWFCLNWIEIVPKFSKIACLLWSRIIFRVANQTNFHRISLKERYLIECGKTELNALSRLALSQKCVNSAQRGTKLTGHWITSDWLMLISVDRGAIFNSMRRARIRIYGRLVTSIGDAQP